MTIAIRMISMRRSLGLIFPLVGARVPLKSSAVRRARE